MLKNCWLLHDPWIAAIDYKQKPKSTKMKKSLLLIVLFWAFLPSCKKDPDDVPLGTIKASIDGSETTFSVQAKAEQIPVQNGYGIRIQGYKKDPAASSTRIEMAVVRPTSITTGNFTENNVGNPLVEMKYYFDFFLGLVNTYSSFKSTANPVTVNITELTSGSVKGTFSGELISAASGGTSTKVKVTNGAFYVSF